MTTGLRMTVEQYLALPEEKPYREYAYGEVVSKAMPNEDHGAIAFAIQAALLPVVREFGGRAGPEFRVRFDTERGPEYRLPDVAYWRPDRPRRDGEDMLPPTLAVEVRSPGESLASLREKCRYYRRYGVDICWLVDPNARTIEIFDAASDGLTRREGDELATPLIPGLRLPVASIFAALED
ncbi:MAG: Uma2 family endonuclease [Dehalococcoidia bacterium]|nr:Uma2 family endonuclease [Dehalococcoidia bacterium]